MNSNMHTFYSLVNVLVIDGRKVPMAGGGAASGLRALKGCLAGFGRPLFDLF